MNAFGVQSSSIKFSTDNNFGSAKQGALTDTESQAALRQKHGDASDRVVCCSEVLYSAVYDASSCPPPPPRKTHRKLECVLYLGMRIFHCFRRTSAPEKKANVVFSFSATARKAEV